MSEFLYQEMQYRQNGMIHPFRNHIDNTDNQFSTEYISHIFDNNYCQIRRYGDYFLPTKIVCYNCNDDFNIKDISLFIGGHYIIKFNSEIMNNIIDFIEDVNIDGNLCKIYHLDKTKLFFNIILVKLQYHDASIFISKSGNCDNIKLFGKYTYLNRNERIQVAQSSQENMIKQVRYGKFDYTQGTSLSTKINGYVNGFILSNLNVNNIKSIKIKINNSNRISYNDKIEILLNTKKINDRTLYVNLNDSHYMDDITNSSSYFSNRDKISFIIESEDENIDLEIVSYSNNIFQYIDGMGGLKYEYYNHIVINNINNYNTNNYNTSPKITPKLRNIIKSLEGNNICPILQEEISDKYISCDTCKYNFDYSIYEKWVIKKNTCPHCRGGWHNTNIYQIPTENCLIV
jgi:hypothetical protein